jgi:hypothetical protein
LYLDIVQFQHVVKLDEFIPVARLMINKWRKKYVDNIYVNDFIEYFVKQWLSPKRVSLLHVQVKAYIQLHQTVQHQIVK